MIPYIVVFLINFCLANQAEKTFFKKKGQCCICLALIVVINTIFVGLRNFGIGIDTLVYINDYFNVARYISVYKVFHNTGDMDVGFLLLAKIASWLSHDSQMLLVLTELVIMGFIIFGLFEYKKTFPRLNFVWFLVLFSAAYYYHSENLMRQFCAMAAAFFAFSQYKQKKYLSYALFQVIALSFHSTASLFFLVPIYDCISGMNGKKKYGLALVAFAVFIVAFVSYYYVITMLGHFGIINEIYADRYGENSSIEGSSAKIGIRYVLEYLVPLFMIYYTKKKKVLSSSCFYMLFVLFISMLIFEQVRFISKYMYRLGFYFGLIYYAYMAMALNTKKIAPFFKFLFVAFMYVDSYYAVIWLTNQAGIGGYEYASKILGL